MIQNPNLIGLLGDTHGDGQWTKFGIALLKRAGVSTILQAGDFGVWPGRGGTEFLNGVNKSLERNDMRMIVAPGNHDDYDQIEQVPVDHTGFQSIRPNIHLAPRGHRWNLGGVSMVALGGAPSVDRSSRISYMKFYEERYSSFGDKVRPEKTWWPQEAITPEDVERTIAGGHADVMLTHDAPFAPSIEARIKDNPHGFRKVDLDYAYEGRMLMQQAVEAVQPKVFIHGHYHFPVNEHINTAPAFSEEEHLTHVFGLDCNQHTHSFGILDTITLTPTFLPWDPSDWTKHRKGQTI